MLRKLATPAVIQLSKRHLLNHAGKQGSSLVSLEESCEENAMDLLRVSLTAGDEGTQELLWARQYLNAVSGLTDDGDTINHGERMHSSLFINPSMAVSDIQLLRAIFASMRGVLEASGWMYELVMELMRGWRPNIKQHVSALPSPSPTTRDQIKGVYMAAHHCGIDIVDWMLTHEKEQREQQLHCGTSIDLSSSEAPRLPGCFPELVRATFTNASVRTRLADLETTMSECGHNMVKQRCISGVLFLVGCFGVSTSKVFTTQIGMWPRGGPLTHSSMTCCAFQLSR